jgi:hypothetical protein
MENPRNLKQFDILQKNEHGNITINHIGEAFIILALLMFGREVWYANYVTSISSMHLCHKRYWFLNLKRYHQ